MKKTAFLLTIFAASLSLAQASRASVYIEPQQGFETYVAAAIAKKGVPVDIVTERAKAAYILKSAPVEVKSESTGGKIARCLFAYCAGIEDKGNVSVQLIEANSTKILWAYSVNKQRGGSKNEQSMAEAVAKHFKEFLSSTPALAAAPPVAADSSIAPVAAPALAAGSTTPAPKPVSYQQVSSDQDQPAMQRQTQVVTQDQNLGDAARRAKQHKACLELAKDNPAITCN